MVRDVVVFDIWGELGHFRRFFTTSSPLTFSFPPPTTVRGIVGAILGLSKDSYIGVTNNLDVGVSLLNPVKKQRFGLNFINTKGSSGFEPTLFKDRKEKKNKPPRTQVQAEFLKDPKFRVFISGEKKLLEELLSLLKDHRTNYTVSLGISECIADFSLIGKFRAVKVNLGSYVNSVIPVENVLDVDFKQGKVMKERIPSAMNENRETVEFKDVVFNPDGKPLIGEFNELWEVEETGEKVYLFTFPSQ